MDETMVELPGYYSFTLDSVIHIPAGEDFYIQIKYDSNDPENLWPIAIEDTIGGYAMPEIETGKFWIAPDPNIWPTAWYPVGHGTNYAYDLCIKAYAHELYTVSGNVIYDDSLQTALENIRVYLLDADSCRVDSILTSAAGFYSFAGLRASDYSIALSTDTLWGGVNTTDALAAALHFNAIPNFELTGLPLLAADVNNDAVVDSVDVELIQNRTIHLIQTFPASDIVYAENSFELDGTDLTKNVKILFRGDVNASRFSNGK
jgi:hypothetical protein